MEASQTTQADVPAEGESADGTSVAVGDTNFTAEHQPIGEDGDGHGTVTPRSAPAPSAQSGDPLDDATKAGLGLGGKKLAAGESSPPE